MPTKIRAEGDAGGERIDRSEVILGALRDAAGRHPGRFDALLRRAFPELARGEAPRTFVEEQAVALRAQRTASTGAEVDTGRVGVIPVAVYGRARPRVTELFLRVRGAAVTDAAAVGPEHWLARAQEASRAHLRRYDVPTGGFSVEAPAVPPYSGAEVLERSLEAAGAVAIVSEVMRWEVPAGTFIVGCLDVTGDAAGVRMVGAKIDAALDAVAQGEDVRRLFVSAHDRGQVTPAQRARAVEAGVSIEAFATLEDLLATLGAPWVERGRGELSWGRAAASTLENFFGKGMYLGVLAVGAVAFVERATLAFVQELTASVDLAVVVVAALACAPTAPLGVRLALALRRRFDWLAGWIGPTLTVLPGMWVLREVVRARVRSPVAGSECSLANNVVDIAPKDAIWWIFAYGLVFVVPVVRLHDAAERVRRGRSLGTLARLFGLSVSPGRLRALLLPEHPRFTALWFPLVFTVLLVQMWSFLGRCSWQTPGGAWSPWLKPHQNMTFIQSFAYWLLAMRLLDQAEATFTRELARRLPPIVRGGIEASARKD